MSDHARSESVRHQMSPIEVERTRVRQRPETDFATTLRRGAAGTLQAVHAQTAGYLPPAGAVVSAALAGAGSLLDAAGADASLPPGGLGGALAGGGSAAGGGLAAGGMDQREVLAATERLQRDNQMFNLRMVNIQESFARDGRMYTAISNLMKAKNDTARNTLSNLR